MSEPDTLILLSGGIDSAYCLHQHLQQGKPALVHHVTLADHEGRAQVEDNAVTRIVAWMRSRHKTPFTYSRSKVDFGDVRWIPKNYHLWAYWCGVLLANPANQSVTKIVIPRHIDAFTDGPFGRWARRSDEAYTTITATVARRKPELVYPIVRMTKAEVIRDMPPDLLRLCWWCRRPGRCTPANTCMTCRVVNPVVTELHGHAAIPRR